MLLYFSGRKWFIGVEVGVEKDVLDKKMFLRGREKEKMIRNRSAHTMEMNARSINYVDISYAELYCISKVGFNCGARKSSIYSNHTSWHAIRICVYP